DRRLSHDDLLLYEQIIERHTGAEVAVDVIAFRRIAPNVHFVTRYFRWRLIEADPDDDKFVDCGIAGRADGVVTHDRHFDVWREIAFPYVRILTLDEFKQILDEDVS